MKSLLLAALSLVWPQNQNTNVMGYRVYFGPSSGVYTQCMDCGPSMLIPLPGPTPRPFYSVVTAYGSNGLESDFSAELVYPHPIVATIRFQCSTKVEGPWTNVTTITLTNTGAEGQLFFRAMMDVGYLP